MKEHVIKVLSKKDAPRQLEELRQRCQGLVKMSRSVMKDYYTLWDRNEAVYRGERRLDEQDKKAIKRDESVKVIVPLTHSQIQTFVAFGTMLLTQREYIYELAGTGLEDEKPAKLAQAVLQRDLEYNKFEGVLLPQFLTDVARFGLGIFKSDWTRQTVPAQTFIPDPSFQPVPGLAPTQIPQIPVYTQKTKYLGNNITVVSPYRWYPDTRLPLTRYRYGEFCADENEYSFPELKKLELAGTTAGIDEISRLPDDAFENRRLNAMTQDNERTLGIETNATKTTSRYCLITEVEILLNPAKTEIDDGVMLDKDLDAEVVCLVWIANDGRIVRLEDAGYNHNEFLFDAAQFFNDQNRVINFGLAELIGPMQDTIDWLMGARVTNVRKSIQNQLVVDPRFVDMDDVRDRSPILRLKSTTEGMAITNYIHQLQVVDVTAGHINDMGIVKGFSQDATGLSENLVGQYSTGRRSAREASNVNSNAAARVILPLRGIQDSALLPLGRKLLSNIRQGLDEQQLVSIVGLQALLNDPVAVQDFLPIDRSQLVGNYDFLVYDLVLPSQRIASAQTLQELLIAIANNPMSIFILGIDPKIVMREILTLRGITNVDRFNLTPERFRILAAMAGIAGNQGGPGQAPGTSGTGPAVSAGAPADVPNNFDRLRTGGATRLPTGGNARRPNG